jgi:hypothetical protein
MDGSNGSHHERSQADFRNGLDSDATFFLALGLHVRSKTIADLGIREHGLMQTEY